MVPLINLVFLPFMILMTSHNSSYISNNYNHHINNINNVSENISYSSVEEVKALMLPSEVNVKGVVTSKLFDGVYIADQFKGIGIKVTGNFNLDDVELKSIVGVTGVLHIDSKSHVKYIKDAETPIKLVANNDVTPIKVSNPNEYLIPEHVGDIVILPTLRYHKLNKLNDYNFTYEMGSKCLDLSIKNNTYLNEEANFLNSIGKLNIDNSDTPLIQDDYYDIEISNVTTIVNVNDNNIIQYDLFEESNLNLNYKNIIKLVTLYGINNENQCIKQFDIAKTFILNMPKAIIDDFKITNDFGLKPCRERYIAWAKYHNVDPWTLKVQPELTLLVNDGYDKQFIAGLALVSIPIITVIIFMIYKSHKRRYQDK